MKKIQRKLIAGSIAVLSATAAAAGILSVSGKADIETVSVSAGRFEETPVIILDAGHGAST